MLREPNSFADFERCNRSTEPDPAEAAAPRSGSTAACRESPDSRWRWKLRSASRTCTPLFVPAWTAADKGTAISQERVFEGPVEDRHIEQKRLIEREPVQADAGDRVVKDSIAPPKRQLLVAEHIPGESKTRRQIVPLGFEQRGGDTGVCPAGLSQ